MIEIQEASGQTRNHSQPDMEICYGGKHIPIPLSSTRRYTPDQIRELCRKVLGPFYLKVQGSPIAIYGEECMVLACHACAAYHDWLAYNAPLDDGFEEDMAAREECMKQRWEEPISDLSDDGGY